jgi:hypothetical protein
VTRRPGSALAMTVAFLFATSTCVPDLGPGDSLLTSTRILAVRAEPAEAPPGTKVTFEAFVAGPSGVVATAPIVWDFCAAPRPLTDDNVVSSACLGPSALVSAGTGPTTVATTPPNGCSLFGPDPPSGGFRPADPDATGGYYQPLRLDLAGAQSAFALARIHCDLANAGAAAAATFAAAYKANQNPALRGITGAIGGVAVALNAIPAGARVDLTAAWSAADAETFAYFDPSSQSVSREREAMQVAWYATLGAFATESTGRAATDATTSSDDVWTAPSTAGIARVFVVLRDSRGGVDFASVELTVVR